MSPKTPSIRVQKNHPSDQIIRNKYAVVETRRKICSPEKTHLALLSTIEPNCFEEANKDGFWNKAMDEELDQILKKMTLGNWFQDQRIRMRSTQNGFS